MNKPRAPVRTLVLAVLLILLLVVDGSETVFNRHHHRHHHVHHWGPFFEETESSPDATLAAVVPLGGAVDLNCKVAMLHDKTVMWLRRTPERVTLLTVGNSLYSSDPRMAIKFQYPSNWKLRISHARKDDEGQYMCQVSTHPPRVLLTNLTVLAPELKIVDELGHSVHDRYYKTGSTIELTCKIMTSVEAGKVTWFKDDKPLSDKLKSIRESDKNGDARLVIPRADKSHSGTYGCSLSKNSSVLVHVTVLNGETQAAVQHDTWNKGSRLTESALVLLLVALIMLQ